MTLNNTEYNQVEYSCATY